MNGIASVAILDALIFPPSIVLDFLGDFNEGGCFLQARVVVGIVVARLLVIILCRIPAAIVVVRGPTLVA